MQQTTAIEGILADSVLSAMEDDIEFFEPRRVEISPLTLFMLADGDDFFDDLD